MAKTTTIPAAQSVRALNLRMDNSSSITVPVAAATVGANDALWQVARLTSTDTVARLVQIFVQYGGAGNNMLIGTVNVPITAGNDGVTQPVDGLHGLTFNAPNGANCLQFDAYGNLIMKLPASSVILAMPTVAITAGKFIYLTGDIADF